MPGRRHPHQSPERPQLDLTYTDFQDSVSPRLSRREARKRAREDQRGVDDEGLFQVIGVLVAVSALVVAVTLPMSPLRLVGRDGGDREVGEGVAIRARGDMPDVPDGLTAVSRLFELNTAGLEGPQSIEITLRRPMTSGQVLGFFTHEDGAWKRLGPATLSADGRHASGEVPYPPKSVAVLRADAVPRALALVVEAGESPDPKVLARAAVVAVRGASLRDPASLTNPGALEAARVSAPGKPLYLVVGAGGEGAVSMGLLGPDPVGAIAEGARAHGASGVVMDLGTLPSEQRPALTQFARDLAARMRTDGRGLVWAVPAAGPDGGAYDWKSLIGSSDGLWLLPRGDLGSYYPEVEAALAGARAAGVDLTRVSLVLDRRSQEVAPGRQTAMSRHDALALASTIRREAAPGGLAVQVSAPFLGGSGGGLRWDERARAVGFAFVDGAETHRVWVENRFSAAFRLEMAHKAGLGGVAVDQATASDSLADVWDATLTFADGSSPRLERPHGRYLVPCWQSMGGGTVEGVAGCWEREDPVEVAVWRAPANAGSYTLRLVVSDGVTFVGQEISIRVSQGGRVDGAAGSGRRPVGPVRTSNASDASALLGRVAD